MMPRDRKSIEAWSSPLAGFPRLGEPFDPRLAAKKPNLVLGTVGHLSPASPADTSGGQPLIQYDGAGWAKCGDFLDKDAWVR